MTRFAWRITELPPECSTELIGGSETEALCNLIYPAPVMQVGKDRMGGDQPLEPDFTRDAAVGFEQAIEAGPGYAEYAAKLTDKGGATSLENRSLGSQNVNVAPISGPLIAMSSWRSSFT